MQTKGVFLAITLLMRLDISLLGDFLALYQRSSTGATRCKLAINMQVTREECSALIKQVGDAMRFAHVVDGYIFLAQLLTLERLHGTYYYRLFFTRETKHLFENTARF